MARDSTEKLSSKALIDSNISLDEFISLINKEKHYLKLKEIIRTKYMVKLKLGEIETDRLIQHGKKIGIDEILKQNERWSLKPKSKVQNLLKLYNVIILVEGQKKYRK